MFFLTPRHVKFGRHYAKEARKLVAYKRDLWSEATVVDTEKHIDALEAAVREKDKGKIETAAENLDKLLSAHVPVHKDTWLRENVEVFLVAIVVALGVRTYILQPFTIPTGSMQPTLNGIIFHPTADPAPNPLVRAVQVPIFGRHYVDQVAQEREKIIEYRPAKSLLPFVTRVPGVKGGFFDRTEIVLAGESGGRRSFFVKEALETVDSQFKRKVDPRRIYAPGEVIMRGYFDAGDHVFVDKISYHFRKPHRGETFVFSTAGIPLITPEGKPSQYYIKRLAGVPGDTLQVRPPELCVNGSRAEGKGFERVMSGTREKANNGYRGYGNEAEHVNYDQAVYLAKMTHLSSPTETFKVESGEYFAMGDNSYNSFDSRGWGTVPERNIMGKALMVYWPFLPHFGLAK
jgi:signal peptidase I